MIDHFEPGAVAFVKHFGEISVDAIAKFLGVRIHKDNDAYKEIVRMFEKKSNNKINT